MLLVGKIASAATFEPTHATIVQNKDDVLIPLLLEQIPSAKAFRDAIESLSPEQQRFAKAFRAMQLESTLFAVAVVEIKPQLERLLVDVEVLVEARRDARARSTRRRSTTTTTKQASASVVGAPRRSLPVLALFKSIVPSSELHSISPPIRRRRRKLGQC